MTKRILILKGSPREKGNSAVLAEQVADGARAAGVDNAWEQKKLEARKMLEKPHRTPASSARFVGRLSL